MQEKTFIYALVDPITEQVRYIGKSNNPRKRYNAHLTDTRFSKHKINWIKKLKEQSLVPVLQILEEVSQEIWQERERYWIAFYREHGHNLINETDGGEGMNGWEATPEVRAKRSESLTGKVRTPETIATLTRLARERAKDPLVRANMSASAKTRKYTPEGRANMSKARKTLYANNPEIRVKMSEKRKGRTQSEETRAKRSATMKAKYEAGWDIGEDARAKISESKKDIPRSNEVRAKISTTRTGMKLKPLTEEHKAKLSAAKRGKPNPKISEAKKGKPTNNPRCPTCGRFLNRLNLCSACTK